MNNVKIKDLPVLDRPIERLIELGTENLSNEELLAIILKTGTKNNSAKILAMQILKEIKKIQNLKYITYDDLKKIKGIGNSKAASILALIELSKRINNNQSSIQKIKLSNTIVVFDYFKKKLDGKMQEHFYVIYLDNHTKIIKEKLLFIGTLNYSLVHPREIFKEALLVNASSIICVHNHPSGNCNPSKEDINITRKLIELGKNLGINIIDHIIIGIDKYYSFYENGNI